MNCSVFSVIKYHYTTPHYSPDHCHPFYELNFYFSGNGYTEILEERFDFTKMGFAIIPPNAPHNEQFSSAGIVLCILFEADALPFEYAPAFTSVNESNPIFTYAQMLFKESTERDENHAYISNHLLKILLMEIKRILAHGEKTGRSLDAARKYIIENYYKKLNFNELANMSGYSYDYFRHTFKRQYGVSPQAYLINVRLETAYSILSSSPDRSITEVASDCGFSDCSQFSAMFTRRFGITPKQFAKSIKEKYK